MVQNSKMQVKIPNLHVKIPKSRSKFQKGGPKGHAP